MPILHVLRVFVNEDREWGNPLGVFLAGEEPAEDERQDVAAELGFSETAFVEAGPERGIHIHTPAVELPFAGHPCVGAAWLLAREGSPVDVLRPPAGEVGVRRDGDLAFIAGPSAWAPPFEYVQLDSPAGVRALRASELSANTFAWSWIDEAAGTIRARSFVPEAGIVEDEATGSAALALCARLGRPVTIHQGHGSVLLCRPLADGRAEVGGMVVLDEVREYRIPSQT